MRADGLLDERSDDLFAALADRTRRRILVRLAERPDDAGAVAQDLELSRQAVAKHLRVLEEAGIVQAAMVSRRRVHTVEPARIREVSELLGLLYEALRDLILLKRDPKAPLIYYYEREAATALADEIGIRRLLTLADAAAEATEDLGRNANVTVVMSTLLYAVLH